MLTVPIHLQVVSLVGGITDSAGHSKPSSSEASTSSLNVSGLQQLLAGEVMEYIQRQYHP